MNTTEVTRLRDEARNLFRDAEAQWKSWHEDTSKMPADALEQYNRLLDAVIAKNAEADSLAGAETKRAAVESYYNEPDPSKMLPQLGGNPEDSRRAELGVRQMKAFTAYLTKGESRLSEAEHKDLQVNSDTLGGFFVAPQQFVEQIIKFIDNDLVFRGLATTFMVPKAQSLGAPSWDADPADPDWTGEVTTVANDTAATTGKRELRPYDLTKQVKISKKLLAQSIVDPAAYVAQRLAYKMGVAQEKAFLTGTGSNQPLGVFTASAQGISTGQDFTCANATSVVADDFKATLMKLKPQYQRRPGLRWIFHRDVLKAAMLLKDSQQRPLYADLQGSAPPTMVGLPYLLSEYAPNTFTTGLYVGIIGDFSFYWIADAMDPEIQALVELYAATNQNGYIIRGASDGMPILEEAFVRMKLA